MPIRILYAIFVLMNVLVTGSSGQVGRALLGHHHPASNWTPVPTAHRGPSPDGLTRHFDWTDPSTFEPALDDIDAVFLLRPPALSDVDAIFSPFIQAMERHGIRGVVFLSVQGAESASIIPHARIENRLAESSLRTVVLRPSYFMQNLSTTLADDIRFNDRILLPAGTARFLWIDVEDIGAAAASIFDRFDDHAGCTHVLTGRDLLDFESVAELLGQRLGRTIRYRSTGPVRYYLHQRLGGMNHDQALVMTALHTVPRFTAPPSIEPDLDDLIGRPATRLDDFIAREQAAWFRR